MGDALTDIYRDSQRVIGKIDIAKEKFVSTPTKEKANNLIELWNKYLQIEDGCWENTNGAIALEQISLLKRYLDTGDSEGIGKYVSRGDPYTFDEVISIGRGFIVGRKLNDWVMENVESVCRNTYYYKKFRIRLKLESVEEISCKDCPYVGKYCVGCESINQDELNERLRKIEEWDK